MSSLQFQNVVKTFQGGAVRALDGVSLEIKPEAFIAIMGASGSGKSTLLHLAAGLTQPDSGKVFVADEEVSAMNDRELTMFRRKQVGLIFQSFNLMPTLTARENVALPLRLDGLSASEIDSRVNDLLEKLQMTHRAGHRPDAMSGGEQQRIAIARALAIQPAVLLADEPTGNLDSENSRRLCELLQKVNQEEQVTILMVTHEPSVAYYAKSVALIRDGLLVEEFETGALSGTEELATQYQQMMERGAEEVGGVGGVVPGSGGEVL